MQEPKAGRIDVLCKDEYVDGEDSVNTNESDEREEQIYVNEEDSSEKPVNGFLKSIEEIPWFHKGISRNSAEAMLLANSKEGSYLLRDSKGIPGQYTVSVRYSSSVKHFSLNYNGRVYLFGVGEFESLEELVDHFRCLPVLGTETGGTVTLRYPYLNDIPEPNVYEKIVRHAEYNRVSSSKEFSSCLPDLPDLHIASKEGYLVKRGAIRKSWKKRWFVLHKNELKYFRLKGNSKPIRTLNLEDAIAVTEVEDMRKLNCFALSFPWRTFFLYACTSKEAGDWIRILTWKLEYYKKRKHPELPVDPLASIA